MRYLFMETLQVTVRSAFNVLHGSEGLMVATEALLKNATISAFSYRVQGIPEIFCLYRPLPEYLYCIL